MYRHNGTIGNLSMPLHGIFVGLVMLAAPTAQAGGWLQKTLNAQPQYQNQPNYRQGNQQAKLLQFNVSVRSHNAGQPAQAVVQMVIQPGTNQSVQDLGNTLTVRYTLIDLHGQARGTATKPVEITSSNALQSTLNFTPPRGIPHGRYRVDAELLLNGSSRGTRSAEYQII